MGFAGHRRARKRICRRKIAGRRRGRWQYIHDCDCAPPFVENEVIVTDDSDEEPESEGDILAERGADDVASEEDEAGAFVGEAGAEVRGFGGEGRGGGGDVEDAEV